MERMKPDPKDTKDKKKKERETIDDGELIYVEVAIEIGFWMESEMVAQHHPSIGFRWSNDEFVEAFVDRPAGIPFETIDLHSHRQDHDDSQLDSLLSVHPPQS